MATKLCPLLVSAFLSLMLSACGGAKILKEPIPMDEIGPLAAAGDEHVNAVLDWVIVRDGPGTWSRDAYWDEYLLRIVNASNASLSITSVEVLDALEQPVAPRSGRRELEKATRTVSRHYKELGYDISPGANGGHMVAAGTGAMIGATGIVYAGLTGALGGGAVVATGAWVATGLVLASPVLLAGGLVKASNNEQVDKRIQGQHTAMPVILAAGEQVSLDLFFPVSPSPTKVRVYYETADGQHSLAIATAEPMRGLHIKNPDTDD